jgi:hypothetical protein
MLGLYLSSKNKKSLSLGIYFQHERFIEASIQHGYCDFGFLEYLDHRKKIKSSITRKQDGLVGKLST